MNDAPQQNASGITPGEKPLFHSRREIALMKDTCIKPGFGLLLLGTVLAASVTDELMTPMPLSAGDGSAVDPARPLLVVDGVDTENTVSVSEANAAKFRVGDDVVINTDVPAYLDLGAITDIADAVAGVVVITFTNALDAITWTVANGAALSHKTKAATPFYEAAALLDQNRDSGESSTDKPAPCNIVLGNAIVYTVNLTGMTAVAITDLGVRTHGVHSIF